MYNYPEGHDSVSMGTVWKDNQMKQERFIGRSKEKEILEEYLLLISLNLSRYTEEDESGKPILLKKG